MKCAPLVLITLLLTVVIWLVQTWAIANGLAYWFVVPLWLTAIGAFCFGWIPAFAPIVAMFAAVQVWGWSWLAAFVVFFGVYILYGVLFVLGGLTVWDGVKYLRGKTRSTGPITIYQ